MKLIFLPSQSNRSVFPVKDPQLLCHLCPLMAVYCPHPPGEILKKSQGSNLNSAELIERHRRLLDSGKSLPIRESNRDLFFENRVAISVSEAAFALGISVRTVERIIQRGELRTRRIGKRILIPKNELGAWLNRKE